MAPAQRLQWCIWLVDSDPPIWRRFQVSDRLTLAALHQVLQQVMGWQAHQPYRFELGGDRYAAPTAQRSEPVRDATATTLSDFNLTPGTALTYLYDFRDGWLHRLTLEAIVPAEEALAAPHCLAGERACPPEHCGGVWGYEALLERLEDPEDPDYEDLIDQVGGDFDPEFFDVDAVNRRLLDETP